MNPQSSALTGLLAALLLAAAPAEAAARRCSAGRLPELVSLREEASRAVAAAYKDYNPLARKGVQSVLWAEPAFRELNPQVLDDILDIFGHNVVRDINPLGTDQGLFEAIGELTDDIGGQLTMREGLVKTLKDLGNREADEDAVAFFQGAAFDLFMARDRGYSAITGLQRRVDVPGTGGISWREADLVETCPGDCLDLPGILHENKNWSTALIGSFDGRLTALAAQFRRDILIHNQTDFAFYRLNLRTTVEHQRDMIRDVLLTQFSDPAVREALGTARSDTLRELFLARWNEAGLVTFR